MRKFKVKVNGKEYEVEIEEIVATLEADKEESNDKAENKDTAEVKAENS